MSFDIVKSQIQNILDILAYVSNHKYFFMKVVFHTERRRNFIPIA